MSATPDVSALGPTNYTLLPPDVATCVVLPAISPINTSLISTILHSASLVGQLSQSQTNGNTTIGTLDFPGLPKWVPAVVRLETFSKKFMSDNP